MIFNREHDKISAVLSFKLTAPDAQQHDAQQHVPSPRTGVLGMKMRIGAD
jgi:hypothetical protein